MTFTAYLLNSGYAELIALAIAWIVISAAWLTCFYWRRWRSNRSIAKVHQDWRRMQRRRGAHLSTEWLRERDRRHTDRPEGPTWNWEQIVADEKARAKADGR